MAEYKEAYEASKEYFNGNDLSAKVFVDKYAMRDNNGEFLELTPHAMHDRLANEFAKIDARHGADYAERFKIYRDAQDMFARVVAQGSPMSAVGNTHQRMSASNCVVVESPKDDMGGIIDSGKELAQLYKRRCVAAHSKIITQENGVLNIEDVIPGMHVLSYDVNYRQAVYKKVLDKFETNVDVEDRIVLKYSNGTTLKTSKKHPVLEINNLGYAYTEAGNVCVGSVNVKPNINIDVSLFERNDVAWFIGAHMGDGSADRVIVGDDRGRYDRVRFRMSGDNEEVIGKYCEIHNSITHNNSNIEKITKLPVGNFHHLLLVMMGL
jgi:ribonucleotide reductase alpha subunit